MVLIFIYFNMTTDGLVDQVKLFKQKNASQCFPRKAMRESLHRVSFVFVQSLLTFASKPVIIRVVHRSCHAKVTQLDHVTGTYHAVPQCQIAMKENNRRHLISTFEHARTSLAGTPPSSPPLLGAFGLRTSVVRGFELSSVRANPH